MPRLKIRLTRLAVSDIAWVATGQGLSAIGALVGLRLMTEVVEPHTYGAVVLSLGLVTLALNVGCSPLMQALQHFYPQAQHDGQLPALRAALYANIRRVLPWCGAGFVVILIAFASQGASSFLLPALLLALLACDFMRNLQLGMLNAARRHRRYALWLGAEAWLRPLAATLAILRWPESPELIVCSYLAVGLALLLAFKPSAAASVAEPARSPVLEQRMLGYAAPLFALGVIDWSNGMADRYLIGGLLSVADAGLYAAAYSLASRPFLLLGQTFELAVRPPYQAAISRGDSARAHQLLRVWCSLVGVAGLAGVALMTIGRDFFAGLMLGASFRQAADLMPYIAAGYSLLTLAQVFQRVCFAHGQTRWVLFIQTSAAAVGITATAIGASLFGLAGAAAAVPLCFLVQLAVSAYAAWRVHRAARRQGAREPGFASAT